MCEHQFVCIFPHGGPSSRWKIDSPIFFQPQRGRHSWLWFSQSSWLDYFQGYCVSGDFSIVVLIHLLAIYINLDISANFYLIFVLAIVRDFSLSCNNQHPFLANLITHKAQRCPRHHWRQWTHYHWMWWPGHQCRPSYLQPAWHPCTNIIKVFLCIVISVNMPPPLDEKGGIFMKKVFSVFSDRVFWACFGIVM